MVAKRKRGGQLKANYVTSWGETIDGAYLGSDGRLRPSGQSSPAFGGDESMMVHKFRLWQQSQGGIEPLDLNQEGITPSPATMLADAKAYFRNLILTNPKQAAIELDVPHLEFYPAKPDKPTLTLAQLGDKYIEEARNKQGKPLDKKHKKNSAAWWNEFLETVKVRYARDLTEDVIETYWKKIDGADCAPATKKNRLVKVKAILNWGVKKIRNDSHDCRLALDTVNRIFEIPEVESEPNPIKPQQFKVLLEQANTRMKAALLLGLNCAMHSGEVAKTRKSDIDLEAKTLEAKRSKTSKRRAAFLWERTVEAIKAYQKEKPNQSDFLFASRTGLNLTGESIRQLFVTLRDQCGFPDVEFEGLRDAAYTIACQVDSYYAKFVAGHTIKDQSAKYVVRGTNPKVKECCEAIERHFFA